MHGDEVDAGLVTAGGEIVQVRSCDVGVASYGVKMSPSGLVAAVGEIVQVV
jgi:hypothetical protein